MQEGRRKKIYMNNIVFTGWESFYKIFIYKNSYKHSYLALFENLKATLARYYFIKPPILTDLFIYFYKNVSQKTLSNSNKL